MNQDPKRLLLDPELAPELGEQLKQFDQHCQGQPFDLHAGLARFEAAISAAPVAGASAAGAGLKAGAGSAALAGTASAGSGGVATGAAVLTGLKGLIAAGALAGAGALAWTFWPTPAASPAPQNTPSQPASAQPATATPSPKDPASSQRSTSSATLKENPLQAELAVVKKARQALAAGQAAKALTLLQDSQEKFANGALVPEREALLIIALSQSGQARKARPKARRFLSKHPESPMANRVRQVLGKGSRRPRR